MTTRVGIVSTPDPTVGDRARSTRWAVSAEIYPATMVRRPRQASDTTAAMRTALLERRLAAPGATERYPLRPALRPYRPHSRSARPTPPSPSPSLNPNGSFGARRRWPVAEAPMLHIVGPNSLPLNGGNFASSCSETALARPRPAAGRRPPSYRESRRGGPSVRSRRWPGEARRSRGSDGEEGMGGRFVPRRAEG